jgi:ankyrin repeat protein
MSLLCVISCLFAYKIYLCLWHTQNNFTALILAAGKGYIGIVSLLVDAGADLLIRNDVK